MELATVRRLGLEPISIDLDGFTAEEVAQELDNIAFDYINLVLLQSERAGVAQDVPKQVFMLKALRDAFKKQTE